MESEKGTKQDVELCKQLLRAAKEGDAENVRELLQIEGVDVSYADEYDRLGPITPLRLACEAGHLEVARVLLGHGEQSREELENSLIEAACEGRDEIVRMLLERGVDPGAGRNQAIISAAYSGHVNMVELLLKDPRVGPAARENDAVRFAAQNGHAEVVQLLLRDPRVDPSDIDIVRLAASNGHCDVLKLLLADERVDGACAIESADSPALFVLLEDERCGISVNRPLFEEHHRNAVTMYDELSNERTARIAAVSWAMKQIGQGWEDLREPTEERMQRLPLDWSRFQMK